ncbi:FMN-binding protein [Sneathiella chinensis]|uniref:FMN-binding protein n=1 Tax=Sneathiella chinensis TaxID=349750 RepID=A0ABQ5U014_9PROT|nr:FMN-binding protein [Sneathiella chinensis]
MLACLLVVAVPAKASETIQDVLQNTPVTSFFPDADRWEAVGGGQPIHAAKEQEKTVGYAFLNTDFVGAVGYSGKPIVVLVALDANGQIVNAKLVHHAEPIVLSGIPEQKIVDFIEGYRGTDILKMAREKGGEPPPVDIVSGATVTVMVIDDSIKRASVRVAKILGLAGMTADDPTERIKRTLILKDDEIYDWDTLVGNGSVRRLHLSLGDINKGFRAHGNAKAIARPEKGKPEGTYIDLYVASLAVPEIARSLLGKFEYRNYEKRIQEGQNAFLIMGRGQYSFRGSGYVRGGIFDRIQIVQDGETIRFIDRFYKNLGRIEAENAPRFDEVGLFYTPPDTVFNPADPWQLQLLVQRAVGALEKVFIAYDISYQLPDAYVKVTAPQVAAQPVVSTRTAEEIAASNALWQRIWMQKLPEIGILIGAITLLTLVFFVQNQIVRRTILTDRLRIAFLLFTLFWIGFYAQAQLSVVNVLVFANALLTDFQWQFFLMEPLIFILWCSVAVSLLFWGRGAFCGWLCPFGALQELLNKLARRVGIKQVTVPWWLHERLWPIKYIIFLALLGVSVYSLHLAETLSEIEPFRTSIVLRFMRGWPYLLFVFSLLAAGLFIERFYCRYLCPLGAALAIPGKLAMFNWLKRYNNCGDPCQKCAQDCMVQAIDPQGNINPNECLYCLNCQQLYYDKDVCPVVIHALAKARKSDPKANATVADGDSQYRRPRRLNQPRPFE